MNLLIIGAPGAGKGTMSDILIKNFNLVHISTGDMLREAVRNETPVGLKAQEYMNKGELVPDEVIHDIIVERLSKDDIDNGFLFDGYPRTRAQAEDLDVILKQLDKKIDIVINLNIADEELIKRITGRRICPTCGEIYNTYFKAPEKEGICDKCGSELTQRKDDNLDSLKVRLSEYHKNTQPVIEYYEDKGLVKQTDASKGVAQVFEEIRSILEGLC